jgi:hypothetical protein
MLFRVPEVRGNYRKVSLWQREEGIAMALTTPATIRRLQRKL